MEKQSTRKFLKLFVALVALFLLGSSALLLSSCKEEHTHDWGEGTVSVQPTCTAQGLKTFECSCGAVRTEPIQATGHSWVKEGEPVAPTCSMEGYTLYECSVCGETKQDDKVPTVGHDFQLVEEDSIDATCTKDGVEVYECSFCGTIYEKTIPASGEHEYDKDHPYLVVEANCIAGGYIQYRCTKCGEIWTDPTSYTPIGTHNYQVVEDESHPATCTESGLKVYECEFCGDRYTDSQYTADNPKLGHDWIENTDADEKEFWGIDTSKPFTVTTSTGEKITYANLAEAKADGWTVSTEAMCSTDGTLSRECDRCGEIETVTIKAPGHKLDKTTAEAKGWFVCLPQNDLTDVDGKKYAYICANGDHCDAKVTIDAEGTTAHYVAPVDHNYTKEDGTEVEWTNNTATCTTAGKEQRDCVECGETDYRDVAALGHDANTKQMDGTTPVLICDEDPALDGEEAGLNALANVLMQKCNNDPVKYAEEFQELKGAYTKYFVTDASKHDRGPAYYCFRCHTFIEAMEHEYVYAALEEGKFDESDYQKDENGKPVEAEITEAEFTCQYVKVCKNCGTTDGKGDHGEATTATCRSGSYCTLCGEQRGGQLYHKYVNMSDILDDENEANTKVEGTDYTYGELRTAYEKVVATQAWMTPDAGQCDKPGKDVAVCVTCLLDAADGAEFDWAPKAVETEDEFDSAIKVTDNQSVSAYTYEYDAKHSYVVAYYTTDAKAWTDGYVNANQHAGRILWQNTNCLFGYKVAYICEDCNKVYSNVPTLDNTTTNDDESKNNKPGEYGYTDSNGFILVADGTKVGDATVDYDVKLTTMPSVDTHKADKHAVYVNDNYKTNGYLAPNCVDAAMIPYFCANCGQKIVVEYGDETAPIEKTTFTEGMSIDTTNFNGDKIVTKNTVADTDKNPDPENHKVDVKFACGTHCKAVDEDGNYVCSALVAYANSMAEPEGTATELAAGSIYTLDASHATVVVTYNLNFDVKYLDDYTLYVAEVGSDAIVADSTNFKIDWTKASIVSNTDKASKCGASAEDDNGGNYTLPTAAPIASVAEAQKDTLKGTYLVLKAADGTIYPISGDFYIYNESNQTGDTNAINKGVNKVQVEQNDIFFVGFGTVGRPAGLPVVAGDAASLEVAFDSNPIETTGTAENPVYTLTVDMAADKVITLGETQKLSELIDQTRKVSEEGVETVDKIVVNMNGSKITQSAVGSFTSTVDVTFVGGELEFTVDRGVVISGSGDSAKKTSEASCMLVVAPEEGAKLTLDGMTITTENTSAILVQQPNNVDPEGSSGGEVVIKNSKIVSGGSYGVGTNATAAVAEQDELKITIENTDISFTTAEGADPVPQNALFVNVPSTVKVSGSTFSANYLPVLVRGGDVTIASTKITLTDGYVDEEVEEKEFTSVVGGEIAISTIKNWAYGVTLQQYRMAGLWQTGIGVSRAVITIGNNSTTSYQYKTNVTLDENVQLINETLDAANVADRMPTVVIASYFAENTYKDEAGKVQVMVNVTAEEEVLGTPEYCSNWIAGTVKVNDKVVTK